MEPTLIEQQSLEKGLAYLEAVDPDLAHITARHGPPPLWIRAPGFATLVQIILEQQVSLASAKAAYYKMATHGTVSPRRFLTYTDAQLKAFGFSRQKAGYCRGLAVNLLDGKLDLNGLGRLPTAEVRDQLTAVRGIGAWTADIYLLTALRRPDIWPRGDLALLKAVQRIKNLAALPDPATFEAIGEPWRPWRAVAARMLWHDYLSER